MLKRLCDFFAGLKMTIVSGIFLLMSLILMLTGTKIPVDPAWVTVIISGYPLLYLAITRLFKQKWVSSCLLISMAMAASLMIGELFAAGEVAFIMSIGAILEDMTVAKAKQGLSALIKLMPTQARVLREKNGKLEEVMVPADEIQKGDLIRVLPGEKIPADGDIVTGVTSVDQSVITGESLPVDKTQGEFVYCGTLNCFGSIDMKATGVGKDSSLQKLIRMVEDADKNKAPIQRIADKWSVWLVPIALSIAIIASIVNYCIGMPIMTALNRGVTVLVVFCPCALALATPTSIMAAIGKGTKRGVIIKSGAALEVLGKADTIAFDKTGTITYGKLEVSDITSFDASLAKNDLLKLAAAAESRSEHPLGKAITAQAHKIGTPVSEIEGFRMQAGCGITGKVEGKVLYCGSQKYLQDNGIACTDDMVRQMDEYRRQGKALVLVGVNGRCAGVIALSDVLRSETKQAVKELHDLGVKTVLLTGDNKNAAAYFGEQSGVSQVCAELLPEQKVETIEKLKAAGATVCMLGDGVNDAPALKTADVGVAMGGTGTDIAVEAADAVLVQDNLKHMVYLKKLAKTTLSTIKFNITASMCINALAVTLSCFGLLNPVTGALVHNAGSTLVVLNAALLYDRKIDDEDKKPAQKKPAKAGTANA